MRCLGGNLFKWFIMRVCRVTGGACDIYSWSATQIRVLLTVTSTGAGDGMRGKTISVTMVTT